MNSLVKLANAQWGKWIWHGVLAILIYDYTDEPINTVGIVAFSVWAFFMSVHVTNLREEITRLKGGAADQPNTADLSYQLTRQISQSAGFCGGVLMVRPTMSPPLMHNLIRELAHRGVTIKVVLDEDTLCTAVFNDEGDLTVPENSPNSCTALNEDRSISTGSMDGHQPNGTNITAITTYYNHPALGDFAREFAPQIYYVADWESLNPYDWRISVNELAENELSLLEIRELTLACAPTFGDHFLQHLGLLQQAERELNETEEALPPATAPSTTREGARRNFKL